MKREKSKNEKLLENARRKYGKRCIVIWMRYNRINDIEKQELLLKEKPVKLQVGQK